MNTSTPTGKDHTFARNWLMKQNWNSEAWSIYALMEDYKGRHDGVLVGVPLRVRAFAKSVWDDVRAGQIASTSTILDYSNSSEAQRDIVEIESEIEDCECKLVDACTEDALNLRHQLYALETELFTRTQQTEGVVHET